MVYVVERYLRASSNASCCGHCSSCGRRDEPRSEGARVRYLGSTIVPGDEACFCEFDGPSEASVAEVNRRAGLPFDRIVPAVIVSPTKGEVR